MNYGSDVLAGRLVDLTPLLGGYRHLRATSTDLAATAIYGDTAVNAFTCPRPLKPL